MKTVILLTFILSLASAPGHAALVAGSSQPFEIGTVLNEQGQGDELCDTLKEFDLSTPSWSEESFILFRTSDVSNPYGWIASSEDISSLASKGVLQTLGAEGKVYKVYFDAFEGEEMTANVEQFTLTNYGVESLRRTTCIISGEFLTF